LTLTRQGLEKQKEEVLLRGMVEPGIFFGSRWIQHDFGDPKMAGFWGQKNRCSYQE